MPDLDTQIRAYLDATIRPVDVEELLGGGAPVGLTKTKPRHSARRGLLVAVAAAVITIVALGFRVLLPATDTPPITEPPPTTSSLPTIGSGLPAPVAAWSLRGDGRDSVGDLDLEFVGDYTLTADGVAFDGLSGKAVTRAPGPLDTTQSLTMSVWASYADKLVAVPNVVTLANESEQLVSVGFAIAGDVWDFGIAERELPFPANGGADIFEPRAVRSNDWVLLTGVSDREAGVIRFYMNGELVDETPSPQPFPASGPLVIGEGWAGAVAEVSVYQTALSADEIAAIYEATRPAAPPPQWTSEPATYAEGVLDGTWDYLLSDDADQRVFTQLYNDYGQSWDEAIVRLGFDGARWWQGFVVDGELWLGDDGLPEGFGGLIRIDGDQLTIAGQGDETIFAWTLDGNELSLTFVRRCKRESGTCSSVVPSSDPMVYRVTEHTFTHSGDDPGF
jgi:Concanavalin A-like lectin/glucanases superfamily